MAVAKGSSFDLPCSCYKVPGLKDPILDTPHFAFLEDRYALGDELGLGQFGVIRSCNDLLTGEALACKSIAKDRLTSPDDLRAVKLEIEVMARLSDHPNVVGLKAVYEDENRVHLVMELCAGGELFHRLERQGRFPEPEAAQLFRHLMGVVVYCHDNGVVHRDLKPENILLATKSSSSPIKLADFGLATYIKPGESLYGRVGSPFYIAPEVLERGYNQAADVWSAGVILYILLSGMPPFWGKTKSRIFDAVRSSELRFPSDPWDQLSKSAKDLVAGMLCRDPTQRLTGKQVLDHSWIKEWAQRSQGSTTNITERSFQRQGSGACSFSTPLVSACRDLSFASPVPSHTNPDPMLPIFTCRSSFSSFLLDIPPCSPTTGFSFRSSCGADIPMLPSPVSAPPSFEFFTQDDPLACESNGAKNNAVHRDSSFGGLFGYTDPPACVVCDTRELVEHKEGQSRKGASTSSRGDGIRRKRNHTIGSGELEQLNLIVSESIIRWASCTQLPSAVSLRWSLVC